MWFDGRGLVPVTPTLWGPLHTPQTPADSRLWGQDSPELFVVFVVTDPLKAESSPQYVLEEEGNNYMEILIF